MVSAPQKEVSLIHIQKGLWSRPSGVHFSGVLSENELDHLFCEVRDGNVQLWRVFRLHTYGNEHIASVCTRIETMYDQTKHLVVIHGGGEWVENLGHIHDYLVEEARKLGCMALRAIVARKELAEILKKKYGCRDFEYLVWKEV